LNLRSRIDSTPRTVDIWLGPDEDDLAYILELAHRPSVDVQASLRFIRGLDRLLNRQWFERRWVVQETILANPDTPLLHSGFASCSWNELMVVLDDLEADESNLHKLIGAWQRELALLAGRPADKSQVSIHVSATVDENEDEAGLAAPERSVDVIQAELAGALARKAKTAKWVEEARTLPALRKTLTGLPVANMRDLRQIF
jgi:hypothetical protein